jgi:hypothetical protein
MTHAEPVKTRASVDALAIVRFLIGAVFGWMIWWASPIWTGEIYPFASNGAYYSVSLFVAALISSLFSPNGWHWGPIGIFAGEVAYILLTHDPRGFIGLAGLLFGLFIGTSDLIVGGMTGMVIGLAAARACNSRCR